MAHPPNPMLLSAEDVAHALAAQPGLTWRDRLQAQIWDVGFLRHLWRNFGEVSEGVYRSNHPGPGRVRGYAAMGIRAILNLRGVLTEPAQRIEAAACAAAGIEFHTVTLSARRAPKRDALLALFDKFDTLPRPFLMHCKSGADRAGLASALYLMDQEGADIARARQELSLRYLHIKSSRTGVLDAFLDLYATRLAEGPIPVRAWVRDEYDRDALIAQSEGRV